MQYVALIHKDPDSAYGVSFPDLPGCIAADDDTEEGAIASAREALASHVRSMIDDGDPVPAPRTLAEILADPALTEDREGATLALISVTT